MDIFLAILAVLTTAAWLLCGQGIIDDCDDNWRK
jgi:hypothetical protein